MSVETRVDARGMAEVRCKLGWVTTTLVELAAFFPKQTLLTITVIVLAFLVAFLVVTFLIVTATVTAEFVINSYVADVIFVVVIAVVSSASLVAVASVVTTMSVFFVVPFRSVAPSDDSAFAASGFFGVFLVFLL